MNHLKRLQRGFLNTVGFWKEVAAAGGGDPAFVGSDDAVSTHIGSAPTWSLTVGAGSGTARGLVFVCMTEAASQRTHNSCTYNAIGLTKIGEVGADGGTAATISMWWMPEANIPSAGTYTLALSISGTNRGHAAVLVQWDEVNQSTPYGTLQTTSATGVGGLPATSSTTQSGNDNDGCVAACAAADAAGTYGAGDISDGGSNLNIVSENSPRNSPGGTLRVAHDSIPDASEAYAWSVAYGAESTIDTVLSASINLNSV